MKIKEITINNYKSIENISFKLEVHGNNHNSSQSMILVGINESGKSNILEAINIINVFNSLDYDSTIYKLAKIGDDITVEYFFEIEASIDKYIKIFSDKTPLPAGLKELINLSLLKSLSWKTTITNDNIFTKKLVVVFHDVINWHLYSIDQNKYIEEMYSNDITEEIAKEYAEENDLNLLTKNIFEELFANILSNQFSNDFPKVIYWKSSPQHLINESISLVEFRDDTNISIPLRNIFRIYGAKEDKDISHIIDTALKNDEAKSELEEGLSEKITIHINKIWSEHQIKIKIKLDGDLCKVHIEDKSIKHKYHKMQNRSDGFKQFIALILSLSAENDSDLLKDSIILLDEPEVHLHPSGVRYMRDEILKIGKNNNVIVATHSHYLIDTNTPQRHFIVEKETDTKIKQLGETANFSDDEVVSKAFGLNILKELIPENILIVEGYGDKSLINHCFITLSKPISFNIKNAAGTSKVNSFAALIAEENINSVIILDDDKEGKQTKSEIIKNLKNHFNKNNVLTLKDVLDTLPEGATLEDLYPVDFVNEFIKEELGEKEINFDIDKPIINQLKSLDPTFNQAGNKDKLDKIKIKLCESFRETYNTKDSIQNKSQRLYNFCEKLSEKLVLKNDQ